MSSQTRALYTSLVHDVSLGLPLSLGWKDIDFYKSLSIPLDVTYRQRAGLKLLQSFLKKDASDVSAGADTNAVSLFLETNDRMSHFDLNRDDHEEAIALSINYAELLLYRWFGGVSPFVPDILNIAANYDTGPGASRGVVGQSYYHKVAAGKLTSTSESLARLYRASFTSTLQKDAEINRIACFGECSIVPGSRLTTVPKSTEISRVICTEPSLNMMFQKGIGSVLEAGLKANVGIDLSVQPGKNAELARCGSIDASYGTIDLKSASDSISLELCRSILPKQLFEWLKLTRSPTTTLPDGSIVDLHMISSMGNAFTFPLQTAIFTALVLGVYNTLSITPSFPRGKSLGNFGVFGDDIIVLSRAYDLVIKTLCACGFIVNNDKSYNTGTFRESCGRDYDSGLDVRGVYLTSYASPQDKISLFNRLARWSSKTGVSLNFTLNHIHSSIDRRHRLYVPPFEDDMAGIHVSFELASELRAYTHLTTIKCSDGKVRPLGAVRFRYDRFDVKSRKIRLLPDGTWQNIGRFTPFLNPEGVFLAALRGDLLGGCLGLRSRQPTFRHTFGVTPGWDFSPLDFRRAEYAARSVMGTIIPWSTELASQRHTSWEGFESWNALVRSVLT